MRDAEVDSFSVRGFFFSVALLLSFHLFAASPSEPMRQKMAAYMLKEDHPIKEQLDALFSSSRVILNLETLAEAGFAEAEPRKFTTLVVTTHPDFPGYVFKLYLDAQRYYKDQPESHYWLLRALGAEKIRTEISRWGREGIFKVPKKWIYELPKEPKPKKGYLQKHFILVEEDMDLVSAEENLQIWKSPYVTPEILGHLFDILQTLGLRDCVKPDNIPFSRDGRIAFIDTQTFGESVRYRNLTPYLSDSNQEIWEQMIRE